MIKAIESVLAPISRYKSLITIAVTHWDLCSDPDGEEKKSIEEKFYYHFNINSIIFTSKGEKGE
jgi:hypothetical protein